MAAVLGLGLGWLLLGPRLPLEASVAAAWGPAWFLVKMAALFAALLPALFGCGLVPLYALRGLARGLLGATEGPQAQPPATFWLWVGATLLLGVGLVGVATFGLGLFLPPSWESAAAMVLFGYASTAFAWRRDRLGWRQACLAARSSWHLPPQRWPCYLVLTVWTAFLLRVSGTFFFQGHEDSYVYHLSLAEVWIQRGQTGVVLSNIYSGYALAIEHYYLFLKLLSFGNAEQNALAQLSHAVIGYGTFVAALMVLGERWLRRWERPAFMLVCLHTWLIFFMLLPKNDAFLAASIMLAVVGGVRRMPVFFLAGACIAMVMKPTAGILFTALGLALLLNTGFLANTSPKEKLHAFGQTLLMLGAGAILMVLVWSPFGWHNAQVTGNPFFPLLGELFHNPYAPVLQDVVPEAEPFHVSPLGLVLSFGKVLTTDPVLLIGLLGALAALIHATARQQLAAFFRLEEVRPTLFYLVLGFILLQLITGEYAKHVEPRHYAAVLGPFMLLATGLLFTAWRDFPRTWMQPALIALVAALGLGYSSLDVAARELYLGLTSGNLTSAFFARKPVIALNHFLAQRLPPVPTGQAEPRLYAGTVANTSYFLPNVEFWHPKETYPAWTWGVETLPIPELLQKLNENHISYVLAEKGSPLARALAAAPPAHILMGVGGKPPVALWQLH